MLIGRSEDSEQRLGWADSESHSPPRWAGPGLQGFGALGTSELSANTAFRDNQHKNLFLFYGNVKLRDTRMTIVIRYGGNLGFGNFAAAVDSSFAISTKQDACLY
jgi:hypothetical protein